MKHCPFIAAIVAAVLPVLLALVPGKVYWRS